MTYLKSTIYYLNEQINRIFDLLAKNEKDQAFALFELITEKFHDILEKNFSDILENLSHQLLENV